MNSTDALEVPRATSTGFVKPESKLSQCSHARVRMLQRLPDGRTQQHHSCDALGEAPCQFARVDAGGHRNRCVNEIRRRGASG